MNSPDPLGVARRGDRPRPHVGTSDCELAVFEATERLLADVPLRELSVAQIIAEAGISRATFYFYFSSKFAVLSGLLARLSEQLYELATPFFRRSEAMPPDQAVRQSLTSAVDLWARHRPALRALHEHWNATEELEAMWISVMRRFVDALSDELERAREAGLIRPVAESRQLATTLVWSTEQCLYLAGLGVAPPLPDEASVLGPVLGLWTASLYGGGRQD